MAVPERKNLLVVGAGASQEFTLPIGRKLKSTIAALCDFRFDEFGSYKGGGGKELFRAIQMSMNSRSQHFLSKDLMSEARQIVAAMPIAPSIDNYLDTHRDRPGIVGIGKMAIVNAILQAESGSPLYYRGGGSGDYFNFEGVSETWATLFASLLLEQSSLDQFLSALENVCFVTFNYDRCIEQFFFHVARNYFPNTPEAERLVLQALDIIHVYGSVGNLDPQIGGATDYGATVNPDELLRRRSRIKVFTEGVLEEAVFEDIERRVSQCEIVMFFGFGFHPINMRVFPEGKFRNISRVIITSRGLSEDDQLVLSAELKRKWSVDRRLVRFDADSCADVFWKFHRFLSAR